MKKGRMEYRTRGVGTERNRVEWVKELGEKGQNEIG